MNGIDLELHGTTYTLRFDMEAWERIEDEVCLVDDLGDKLVERGRIKTIVKIFAILAGCEEEQLRKAIFPGDIRKMTTAIWGAINAGMKMETQHGEDREVDVTLEELEKKEGQDA